MFWILAVALAQDCGDAPTDQGRGWVTYPRATFPMGTPRGAPEAPAAPAAHAVTVEPFELARTEVTAAEYQQCVEAGACSPTGTADGCGGEAEQPVNCVSYRQADQYCAWVGARLPTEPEWEFAARGAEGRWYTWGNTWDDRAFSASRRSVGSCPFTDTPEGVHDLAGSGREWTSTSSGDGSHVTKGMLCAEASCMAYNRFPLQADDEQLPYVGFRCARSGGSPKPPPPSEKPAAPTVHWAMLLDELPTVTGAVAEPTQCEVTVVFAADGTAIRATAAPTCPAGVAPAAVEAAQALRVAGREHGVVTDVPVIVRPR